MATSSTTAQIHARGGQSAPQGARRNLLQLRVEGGYGSAKAFAVHVGIPVTTYSRYERAEEGPACGIPLANAWLLADALGTSIDVVVGRVPVEPPLSAKVRDRFEGLSPESQRTLVLFLRFLELQERLEGRR